MLVIREIVVKRLFNLVACLTTWQTLLQKQGVVIRTLRYGDWVDEVIVLLTALIALLYIVESLLLTVFFRTFGLCRTFDSV